MCVCVCVCVCLSLDLERSLLCFLLLLLLLLFPLFFCLFVCSFFNLKKKKLLCIFLDVISVIVSSTVMKQLSFFRPARLRQRNNAANNAQFLLSAIHRQYLPTVDFLSINARTCGIARYMTSARCGDMQTSGRSDITVLVD